MCVTSRALSRRALYCIGDSLMTIRPTRWRDVAPWSVVILGDHRWTVLPSYPRGVFKLWDRRGPYRQPSAVITPGPDDIVPVDVPVADSEVRELLAVELGAVEICPGFPSAQAFQEHVSSHHDVPYVQPGRWGHPTPAHAMAWHRGLHAGQADAPYALMSVPHTHEGL